MLTFSSDSTCRKERTCAYDCYCATRVDVASHCADFESCWQCVADYQQAPLINSGRDMVQPCIGVGHTEVLCVHTVHEVA